MILDVIVIGAGPTGLACAIELERNHLSYLVFEKGCLVNSLAHFPTNMVYFTTPELLEIGEIPLVCLFEKPTRVEALKYYRAVTETYDLKLHQFERVLSVNRAAEGFEIETELRSGERKSYRSRKVILASGYYDQPNRLGVPGEELDKCSHYYTEAYRFWRQDVAIIGAGNSAAEAALELWRAGARVMIIHRGESLNSSLKYWVEPDLQNRIKDGAILIRFNTEVLEIRSEQILIKDRKTGKSEFLPNDHVLALTGYHADNDFMRSMGIELDPETLVPRHNPETFESNVPGLYLAGVVLAGKAANKIFIENGRFHGKVVVAAIEQELRG